MVRPTVWIELSYDGTGLEGWQWQPHGRAVQSLLESAWEQLTGFFLRLEGCGRTDAGVHADIFTASASWPRGRDVPERPLRYWVDGLNRYLPETITVHAVVLRYDGLQARFDAEKREYSFRFQWGWAVPTQLRYGLTPLRGTPDRDRWEDALRLMLGEYECSALGVQDRGISHVQQFAYRDVDGAMAAGASAGRGELAVVADRYIRRMVRSILGASWAVAVDAITLDTLQGALRDGQRHHRMAVAPGPGLRLTGLCYRGEWIRPYNPSLDWWRHAPWQIVTR